MDKAAFKQFLWNALVLIAIGLAAAWIFGLVWWVISSFGDAPVYNITLYADV